MFRGGETLDTAVNMFLFDYRSIEHCTTRRSPVYLMYNRELRTRFDLLRPSVAATVEGKQRAQIVSRAGRRKFNVSVGDNVMIEDYGTKTDKRVAGKVVNQTSPSTYVVQTDKNVTQKRHTDQLIKVKPNIPVLRRSPRFNRD